MTNQSILFICSVDNFLQYTRRATIEAIGATNKNTYVACIRSFWKKNSAGMTSEIVNLIYFYYFFPKSLLNSSSLLNRVNYYINRLFVHNKFNRFDIVCFTFPTQSHLLPFFHRNKKVFILSDPYHLMKQKKSEEALIMNDVDLIFATSKSLAEIYVRRYFPDTKADIVYWPNCVDLAVWNKNKLSDYITKASLTNREVIIGFAGNFMKITDFDLLDEITNELPNAHFILAGKVEPDLTDSDRQTLEGIFKKKNVTYKGLIPYQQLQPEIYSWDIGIMIDRANEIASYHHHNKFYQYLSLDIPVVYQHNHYDYHGSENIAFGATDAKEFVLNILKVEKKLRNQGFDANEFQSYVERNDSTSRGIIFLDAVNSKLQQI